MICILSFFSGGTANRPVAPSWSTKRCSLRERRSGAPRSLVLSSSPAHWPHAKAPSTYLSSSPYRRLKRPHRSRDLTYVPRLTRPTQVQLAPLPRVQRQAQPGDLSGPYRRTLTPASTATSVSTAAVTSSTYPVFRDILNYSLPAHHPLRRHERQRSD